VNAHTISPEEQIRRVARSLLEEPTNEEPEVRRRPRPDLQGLIDMIDRHLDGDLPPIELDPSGPSGDDRAGRPIA
jgi:hypothetical protein